MEHVYCRLDFLEADPEVEYGRQNVNWDQTLWKEEGRNSIRQTTWQVHGGQPVYRNSEARSALSGIWHCAKQLGLCVPIDQFLQQLPEGLEDFFGLLLSVGLHKPLVNPQLHDAL